MVHHELYWGGLGALPEPLYRTFLVPLQGQWRLGHGVADGAGPVGNGGAADDFDAGRGERPAQFDRVGVRGVAEEELGPDGADLELHPPLLNSARYRYR